MLAPHRTTVPLPHHPRCCPTASWPATSRYRQISHRTTTTLTTDPPLPLALSRTLPSGVSLQRAAGASVHPANGRLQPQRGATSDLQPPHPELSRSYAAFSGKRILPLFYKILPTLVPKILLLIFLNFALTRTHATCIRPIRSAPRNFGRRT